MHLLRQLLLCVAVCCSALLPASADSRVPGMIHYQGRIAVDGVHYDGTGQFKFALVNADGSETYWTNDGTASGEPAAAVSLPVARGLYSVELGDTTVAGMPAVTESVFQGRTDVRLRIWFNDGTHGFQLLAPDQRLVSVPYAFVAGSVAPGAVDAAALGWGTITGTIGCQGSLTSIDSFLGIGALVTLPGTSHVAVATPPVDGTASYTLSHVPAGSYTLRVTTHRGQTETRTVTIAAGETLTENFSLQSTGCRDLDLDGYGDPSQPLQICGDEPGGSFTCTDTDDTDRFVYPFAYEYCDGKDNDGDNLIDEDCGTAICGNGFTEPGEQCDDGGTMSGDGCSDSCLNECTSAADCPAPAGVCQTAVCSAGVCGIVATTGNACDDGNLCTLNDVCSSGVCVSGSPKNCSDGNPCTTDSCDASTGACVYLYNTNSCSDGNACTLNDVCSAGVCVGGTPKNCSDGNVCTTDSCNASTGACVYSTNTNPCSDGNACTLNDVCSAGVCVSGTPKNCSDGNTCTSDVCDVSSGACVNAVDLSPCNDNNPCTQESCSPVTGCAYTPMPNGTVCGTAAACLNGVCVSNP